MRINKLLALINGRAKSTQTTPIFTAAIRTGLFLWAFAIPFKNAVYQISTVLIILLFLAHIASHFNEAKTAIKSLFVSFKNLAILFLIAIFFMLLSTAINYELSTAQSYKMVFNFIWRFGVVFASLCYFFKMGFFKSDELLFFLIAGLVLLAFSGVYQLFYIIVFDAPFWQQHGISFGLSGSLGSRTAFGILAGIGLVLSVGLFYERRFANSVATKQRLLAILQSAIILLFSFCVLFSMARSSWVASCGAIGVYFMLNYAKLRPKDILFLGSLILIAILFLLVSQSLQDRLNDLLSGDSTHRFEVWAWVFEQIKNAPFLGHGMQNFEYLGVDWRTLANAPAPHNLTLNLLLDLGIIGTIAFYALLIMPFVAAFRDGRFVVFAALLYIFIASHFDIGIGSKDVYSYITALSFIAFCGRISELKGVR